MRTITINPEEGYNKRINLHHSGEKGVSQVILDYSAWAEEYGSGTLSLSVQRSVDEGPYLVTLAVSGTTATWTVGLADTQYAGEGEIQAFYTVGSTQVVKSPIMRTMVLESLGSTSTAPDPFAPYVQQVADYAEDAEDAAEDAEESAQEIIDLGVTAEKVAEWNANTTARHTHTNKSVLDGITDALVSAWTAAKDWVTANGNNVLAHVSSAIVHITAAERTAWNGKQDAISDLATIRSGATAGANSVQKSSTATAGQMPISDGNGGYAWGDQSLHPSISGETLTLEAAATVTDEILNIA